MPGLLVEAVDSEMVCVVIDDAKIGKCKDGYRTYAHIDIT